MPNLMVSAEFQNTASIAATSSAISAASYASDSAATSTSAELGEPTAQVADALGDALLVLDQREPAEALPARAEADAGRQGHVALAHHVRAELDGVHLRVRLGDLGPDEHRALRLGDVPADAGQPVDQRIAPALVDVAHLCRVVGRLVHGHGGGDLDRLERAVVEVALQLDQRLDDLGVADQEGATPAGHREALGQRVQLDGALLGPV